MVPSYAFILSAGFGTRMGEYGKSLPKPLWPLFEKSLLEFHILNLLEMGIAKIYVNAHHQAQKVQKIVDLFDKSEVQFLHEEKLLGSGGAFHNLSRKTGVSSTVYSLNVDVFFELTQEDLKRGQHQVATSNVLAYLYPVSVSKEDPYNRFRTENGKLVDIVSPSLSAPQMTFSGCALVDMSQIGQVKGRSQFFTTVADFQNQTVLVDKLSNQSREYWDFGTLENYYLGHKKLLEQKESSLFRKLVTFDCVQEDECFEGSYRAPKEARVINLSELSSKEVEELNVREALLLPGVNKKTILVGNFEQTREGKVYFPEEKV